MADVPSSHCPRPDLIEALARGELHDEQRAAAERLLKSSDACRAQWRRLTAYKFPEIPNYTIIGEVGRGGFGVVYKAVHHAKERFEALKVLSSKTPVVASYFSNEVHLIARLRDSNIATLYEAQLTTPPLYYTMEFVEGERLSEYLKRKDVSLAERIEIIKTVARSLGHAHAEGVVHRDIKPQNILIDPTGQPRIVDFGIAMQSRATENADSTGDSAPEGAVGTLGYVAPEQVAGARPDPRADIFSLGALLFHTITLEPARLARDPVYRDPLLADRRVTNREDLSAIIARCVESRPEDRYATTDEFIDDLDAYLEGRAISARRDPSALRRWGRVALLVLRNYPLAVGSAAVVLATIALTAAFWESGARTATPRTGEGQTMLIGYMPSTAAALADGSLAPDLPAISANDLLARRALHGRLMQKLALARPSVVVWDYFFPNASAEHDPEFIAGVKALRDVGTPVVVGAAHFDMNGEPVLTPEIREAVDGFGTLASLNADYLANQFEVICAFKRGFEKPIPGLAVAAFAAAKYPEAAAQYEMDEANLRLSISYKKRNAEFGQYRWVPTADELPLFRVDRIDPGQTRALRNMNANDRYATARFYADPPSKWDARTVRYEDVIRADVRQLRLWFEHRPIIIAQMIPGQDQHKRDDGSTIFGVQVHAQALDSLLLTSHQTRLTRGWLAFSTLVWCIAAYVLVSVMPKRRWENLRSVRLTCSASALVALGAALAIGSQITELWLLQLGIALCGMLLAGSLTYLAKAYREKSLQLVTPDASSVRSDATLLETTVLAQGPR